MRETREASSIVKSDIYKSHDCLFDEKRPSLDMKSRRYSFIFGEYAAAKDVISRDTKGIQRSNII